MPQWEFRILEVTVDPNGPERDVFQVDVEPGFTPLTLRGADLTRNALSGHAAYEVVFVRAAQAG